MHSTSLILASASPRRAELLQQLHVQFKQMATDIDERLFNNESIAEYVDRMAIEKAYTSRELSSQQKSETFLGADTCGELHGELLRKPENFDHAREMLKKMSGSSHVIYTSFALLGKDRLHCEQVKTTVEFCSLTDEDIISYWNTSEPCDKAGAYAIQGIGAQFVVKISGSYSAVVGLPLYELARALSRFGINTLK